MKTMGPKSGDKGKLTLLNAKLRLFLKLQNVRSCMLQVKSAEPFSKLQTFCTSSPPFSPSPNYPIVAQPKTVNRLRAASRFPVRVGPQPPSYHL